MRQTARCFDILVAQMLRQAGFLLRFGQRGVAARHWQLRIQSDPASTIGGNDKPLRDAHTEAATTIVAELDLSR